MVPASSNLLERSILSTVIPPEKWYQNFMTAIIRLNTKPLYGRENSNNVLHYGMKLIAGDFVSNRDEVQTG